MKSCSWFKFTLFYTQNILSKSGWCHLVFLLLFVSIEVIEDEHFDEDKENCSDQMGHVTFSPLLLLSAPLCLSHREQQLGGKSANVSIQLKLIKVSFKKPELFGVLN